MKTRIYAAPAVKGLRAIILVISGERVILFAQKKW